jgi:hypothetical protein
MAAIAAAVSEHLWRNRAIARPSVTGPGSASDALTLSSRDAKALRLGALALVALLSVSRLFPAIREVEAGRQAIAADRREALARSSAIVKASGRLQKDATSSVKLIRILDSISLSDTTSDGSSVELRGRISAAAELADAQLDSVQTSIDSTSGVVLRTVTATGSLKTDGEGLAAFLAAVETGVPVLVLRHLAVERVPGTREAQPTLRASFTVEGIARQRDRAKSPMEPAENQVR